MREGLPLPVSVAAQVARIRGLGPPLAAWTSKAAGRDGAWIVPAAAFLVSLWRAATLSIAHDEALTVLHFVPLGPGAILGLGPLSLSFANNHPLNTLSIKVLVKAFGLHELVVRTPSLLGHALYLACVVWLIRRHVPRYRPLAAGLMSGHPLLIDLFSAARGYGLGLGWLLAALCCADRARVADGPGRGRWNVAAAGAGTLASLSNLSFLPGHLGVLASIGIVELVRLGRDGHWSAGSLLRLTRDLLALAAASGVPVLIVYGRSLAPGVAPQVFYVGGQRGLWADTVTSLVRATVYTPPAPSAVLNFGLETIAASLVAGAVALVAGLRASPVRPAAWPWWTAPMVALVLGGVTVSLSHTWLGVPYATGRTALFLVPLYLLTLIGLWQLVLPGGRWSSRLLAVLITGLVLGLTSWQISRWQVSYYAMWPYDARTRDAIEVIRGDLAARAPSASQPIRIGGDWLFEPSLNFYRVKYSLPIEPIRRASPRGEYDYYYVRATSIWAERIEHARDIQEAFGLTELAHYADVDAFVFRR